MNDLTYCYTIYGDVIPGIHFHEPKFPDHTVLIQKNRVKDYNTIEPNAKSIELINQFGNAIPNVTITSRRNISPAQYNNLSNKLQPKEWYEFDRRVLFVTGAGMSANCVYGSGQANFKSSDSCPPLGPCLFDRRFESIYQKYPGVKLLLHRLQGPNGVDVETLFEEDWTEIYEYGNSQILSCHINILYFLQELFKHISFSAYNGYDGSNLYAVMIDKLVRGHYRDRSGKRKFAFVTFNEDTILELFLTRYSKLKYDSIDDYPRINQGIFSVFKPHGSWNWGWKIKNLPPPGITADWMFHNSIDLSHIYYKMLGDESDMVDWDGYGLNAGLHDHRIGRMKVNKSNLSIIHPGNENLYFPALLLPYRDKDEFTMPSSHFLAMEHYLSYVETLVIIGWKGNEKLFNKILEQKTGRLRKVIIADPNSSDVIKNLPFLSRPGVEIIHCSGFEDFVLNKIDKELNL